ncbi:MAG: hypothetical protein K6T85_05805 [Gorillibacterium sp.]|nr:hypothetical protein [Gorillibacterium sp.]
MAINAIDLNRPPVPTHSERKLVKQYLLLPILLTMLQLDIDAIQKASLRISFPHVVVLERMMGSIRHDLSHIRQSLGLAGIRIYSEDTHVIDVTCKYICRGYHETFALSRNDVKTEVDLLASHYSVPYLGRSQG